MKEIEIKGGVKDRGVIMKILERQGFMHAGKISQIDIMHDLPDGSLFRSGQKIRIRIEGENGELTYKGHFDPARQIISRDELTVHLKKEETQEMGDILTALGYPVLFTIPKERVVYTKEGITAVFDSWPIIGELLELEGEEKEITALAESFGAAFEVTNKRLKDMLRDAASEAGKSVTELKEEYEKANNINLGNLEVLLD